MRTLSLMAVAALLLGAVNRDPEPTCPPPVPCELLDILSIPVWNILCPGGATNCVNVTVNGVLAGGPGTCPNPCTGAAYGITVIYTGCPAGGCCPGNIDVDATGQPTRNLAVGKQVTLTVGPGRPSSCGGSDQNILKITCAGGGAVLLEAEIDTFCDFC